VDAFNSLSSPAAKKSTKQVKIAAPGAAVGGHIPAPVDAFNAQASKPSPKVLETADVKKVK
jgi:hypothetical protein